MRDLPFTTRYAVMLNIATMQPLLRYDGKGAVCIQSSIILRAFPASGSFILIPSHPSLGILNSLSTCLPAEISKEVISIIVSVGGGYGEFNWIQ